MGKKFAIWSYNRSLAGLIPGLKNRNDDFKVGYTVGAVIATLAIAANIGARWYANPKAATEFFS